MKLNLCTSVSASIVLVGAVCFSVNAQDVLTSSGEKPAATAGDSDLIARVKKALHADPMLYDKHIDVTMVKGKVVMNGFVSSAQDLQKAIRAAGAEAGEGKVVNNLTIKEGGDGGSG